MKENTPVKNKITITAFLSCIIILLTTRLLWNYVAPEFGLPQLTVLKFFSAYFLLLILKALLMSKIENKSNNVMERYEQLFKEK